MVENENKEDSNPSVCEGKLEEGGYISSRNELLQEVESYESPGEQDIVF